MTMDVRDSAACTLTGLTRYLLLGGALIVLGGSGASVASGQSSAAATAGCNATAKLSFNVGAASSVAVVKDDHATTVGSAAQGFAASLQPNVNACNATPSPAIAHRLAAIGSMPRAQVHAALQALLVQVKRQGKHRSTAGSQTASERSTSSAKGAGCPDQSVHVDLHIKSVSDNLAIAQKALQKGDTATATQASAAARDSFHIWVQDVSQNHAETVGDWLAEARAGEQLGDRQVQNYANGRAKSRASQDVATAAQADTCTVKKADFDCYARMLVTAQLVGATLQNDLATAQNLSKAIEDRLQHKAPQGCEEWTITAASTQTMADTGDVWKVTWIAGKFRVNRATGEIDGSRNAGYSTEGWPGLVGSATGECFENDVDMGPSTIHGGPFHYQIAGHVTDNNEFDLTLTSDDATVSVDAPPDCEALGQMAEGFIDWAFQQGIPLVFSVAPDQDQATFQTDDGEGATLTATIKRTPLVAP
jgi:hypothetical protein